MRAAPLVLLVVPLVLAGCTASAPEGPTASPTATTDSPHDRCLLGTWSAEPVAAGEFLEKLGEAQFDDDTVALDSIEGEGDMAVEFSEDGAFVYRPDLSFTIHWPNGSSQGGTLAGEATGTWRTEDAKVFATASSNDVALTVTVGDETVPTDSWGWTELPLTVSRYTCDGGSLTLDLNVLEVTYPMVLVREG